MANTIEVKVPDIGMDNVPVIEVLVAAGDSVAKEQGLITLESDKATMEVPSTAAGTVKEVKVSEGDEVSEGTVILVLETDDVGAGEGQPPSPAGRGNEGEGAPEAKPSGKSESSPPAPAPQGEGSKAKAPQGASDSGKKADIECQVVVLGSGPGGYSAAFRAADLGLDTVLVERYDTLGGVCLNVGCIPSKALLHAAAIIDEAESMDAHGVSFGKPKLDLDKLRGFKQKVVGQLTGGLDGMAKKRKVKTVTGTGVFISPHEMEVEGKDGKKLIRFEKAIIAAGSQALKLPGFPWDDPRIMDSTAALELAEVPKRMLVVGGGIIGLEMATVYAALGSEITVVELADQLMPGADADLVKPLAKRLGQRVKGIHLKTKVVEAKAQKNGIKVEFEGDNFTIVRASASMGTWVVVESASPYG